MTEQNRKILEQQLRELMRPIDKGTSIAIVMLRAMLAAELWSILNTPQKEQDTIIEPGRNANTIK